jgi:transcriptional regulator with XRE-family HTH domain
MAQPRSQAHAAFGLALRRIRVDRGLSQERVAQIADLDRSFYSAVERGERNPSLTTLLRLTEALGVKVSDLAAKAEELSPRASWRE